MTNTNITDADIAAGLERLLRQELIAKATPATDRAPIAIRNQFAAGTLFADLLAVAGGFAAPIGALAAFTAEADVAALGVVAAAAGVVAVCSALVLHAVIRGGNTLHAVLEQISGRRAV